MAHKVLIIDDEVATRRVVSYALKVVDCEVIEADSGETALAQVDGGTFELAFVDLNLPDIDGFTLISQIKQRPHMQAVPCIIFTARSQANDQTRAMELGAVDFLYKPFSTQQLREMVVKHLR